MLTCPKCGQQCRRVQGMRSHLETHAPEGHPNLGNTYGADAARRRKEARQGLPAGPEGEAPAAGQ